MSDKNMFLVFTTGLIIGAVCTWLHTKNKYEKILQEEIESVKKTFSKNNNGYTPCDKDKEKMSDIISDSGYANEEKNDHPYVIPPEEFGEIEGYERISLTYYSNGVLADDSDSKIDNVEDILGTVGADLKDHFGEYEDDSVYVRNDARSCDYEILYDVRTYDEVLASKPYISEAQ